MSMDKIFRDTWLAGVVAATGGFLASGGSALTAVYLGEAALMLFFTGAVLVSVFVGVMQRAGQ
jgi:hypothetical protein